MSGTQEPASLEDVLPTGFSTIQQIRALSNEAIKLRPLVSVMGFVRDQQVPMPTSGDHAKYTLEIMDHSISYAPYGFKIIFFWDLEKMPRLSGVGDVVLVRNAKVQMYCGQISLLSNYLTELHLLELSKIPKSMAEARSLPWSSYPLSKNHPPKPSEINYVVWAYTHGDELDMPSETEFQEQTVQSRKKNDKFSLLEDVKPGNFYNLLGEVIKIYDPSSDNLTLYLSDYTENSNFFNQIWVGAETGAGVARDDWGYNKSASRPKASDWPGPYGKMSLQITLYDSHASFAREYVKVNKWVMLNNVQIKFGKMGGCLEGYLRGDQKSVEKVHVTVLNVTGDPDSMNDLAKGRLKDAIRRKREWEKLFNEQKQALQNEATDLKRKRDDHEQLEKSNSKGRRQRRRAAALEKEKAAELKQDKRLAYNENVRCDFHDQETIPLSKILEPRVLTFDGVDHASPFSLEKYRADVRVVDYFPHKIEDFAFGREAKDYDILSDYSGSEDTDLENDMRHFRSGNGFKTKTWEWRFALLVEDAEPKCSKDRIWLFVNNQAAEGLLGLDQDAGNLRQDSTLLSKLKEQLFKLWGDLEERKSLRLQSESKQKESPPRSFESDAWPISQSHQAGAMPALDDSDDEHEDPVRKLSKQSSQSPVEVINESTTGNLSDDSKTLKASNKPFTCCIKQYGVRLTEDDPLLANAGENQRWQRMFAIFGTMIV